MKKQFTYRWFIRWFVPFPIQLWYFKKHMADGSKMYWDEECSIVLIRHKD